MKRIAAMVVVALSLAQGIVAGQGSVDYCISPANGINLRQTYSTKSPVVAKVPAGTKLQVTYEGSQGNWIRVKHNGQDAWMGRWLSHSRVNCTDAPVQQPTEHQEQQPQGANPDDPGVDNMCYIDRVCTTDQQWKDGWLEYKKKHGEEARHMHESCIINGYNEYRTLGYTAISVTCAGYVTQHDAFEIGRGLGCTLPGYNYWRFLNETALSYRCWH